MRSSSFARVALAFGGLFVLGVAALVWWAADSPSRTPVVAGEAPGGSERSFAEPDGAAAIGGEPAAQEQRRAVGTAAPSEAEKEPEAAEREWRGRILNLLDGRPIVGAEVSRSTRGLVSPTDALYARTDEAGEFVLRWPMIPRVHVTAPGFRSSQLLFDERHDPRLPQDLFLNPLAAIEILVQDEHGRGAADVLVCASRRFGRFGGVSGVRSVRWEERTDVDGRVRLDGVLAGQDLLLNASRGSSFGIPEVVYSEPDAVRLAAGETRQLHWVIRAGATIRGSLVDQFGAPVAVHAIWLVREESEKPTFLTYSLNTHARTATAEDGSFEFTGVPNGDWLVGPAPKLDANVRRGWADVAPLAVPLRIEDGDANLVLESVRGAYIRGNVVGVGESGDQGKSPPRVYAFARSLDGHGTLRTRVDSAGHFDFGSLLPGSYEVLVGTRHVAPDEGGVVVDTGTLDLEIPLR